MDKRISSTWLGAVLQSALLPVILLLLVWLLTACGGGGTGADPTPVPPPVTNSLQASQPGALLGYVQGKLNAQVDQGLAFQAYLPTAAPTVSVAAGSGSTPAFASTTLQEGGVDESDLMKTDGTRVFSLTVDAPGGSRLNTLRLDRRLGDGTLEPSRRLALGGTDRLEGLHLAANGETVALLGQTEQWYTIGLANASSGTSAASGAPTSLFAPGPVAPPQTVLNLVAAKPGQAMTATQSVRIDGQLVDSRLIGNTLYLVTSWYPRLDIVPLPGVVTPADRKAAVAKLTTADLLPKVTITAAGAGKPGVSESLMADTDCYLQTQNASSGVQMTTITAFNLSSPTLDRASRCFLGGTEALYMSSHNLYLATSRYPVQIQNSLLRYPGQVSTDIHKFAIDGMAIAYRGTGEVSGHLGWDPDKRAYRMSEYQGDLRVLSYTEPFGWFGEPDAAKTDGKPSPAVLTVLREAATGKQLQTLATLPSAKRPAPIGADGEQLYAVRFLGNRAYAVTFRRTDPLYVIDLSDPSDPRVTGELKTNGYSDYLLPVGEGLLVGVGKDANAEGRVQGVKVSLFDVSNAAAPRELSSRVIGKAGSASALDYSRHGVNLFTVGGRTRLALPVTVNETPDAIAPGWFYPTYQALFRFDIDPAAKTLSERPALVGQTFAAEAKWSVNSWLGYERSVQIDANVYYLTSQGEVMGAAW